MHCELQLFREKLYQLTTNYQLLQCCSQELPRKGLRAILVQNSKVQNIFYKSVLKRINVLVKYHQFTRTLYSTVSLKSFVPATKLLNFKKECQNIYGRTIWDLLSILL